MTVGLRCTVIPSSRWALCRGIERKQQQKNHSSDFSFAFEKLARFILVLRVAQNNLRHILLLRFAGEGSKIACAVPPIEVEHLASS